MSATASEPLYTLDGGRLAPSGHTRGPWDDAHQHGGPPAALVARAVEGQVGDGFTVTRLTLELLRPVPIAPLAVRARVTRPGRRVVGVDVEVAAGEQPVVRAQAQAVRRADLPVGADRRPDDDGDDDPGAAAGRMPGREAGAVLPFVADLVRGDDLPAFHRTGMEVLTVAGGFDRPGPARAWFRLRRPVVGGEEPTGLQRAAAAADFGNGLSWELPFERWVFLNPDLTVQLARPPVGEWIGLDARTHLSDQGTALAESVLHDDAGRLGRGVQSLILERRAAP